MTVAVFAVVPLIVSRYGVDSRRSDDWTVGGRPALPPVRAHTVAGDVAALLAWLHCAAGGRSRR